MKKYGNKPVAQGDIYISHFPDVTEPPSGASRLAPEKGMYILAHSETGHHHVVKESPDVMIWKVSPTEFWVEAKKRVPVEHLRPTLPHESIELRTGFTKIKRQREKIPGGWQERMVQD